MGTYQIFNIKGQQAGGMMKKMAQEPAAHWLYYITVDAIDAAQDRVKSAGGQVINGPMQVPGGSWIINGPRPAGRDVRAGRAEEIAPAAPVQAASQAEAALEVRATSAARAGAGHVDTGLLPGQEIRPMTVHTQTLKPAAELARAATPRTSQ